MEQAKIIWRYVCLPDTLPRSFLSFLSLFGNMLFNVWNFLESVNKSYLTNHHSSMMTGKRSLGHKPYCSANYIVATITWSGYQDAKYQGICCFFGWKIVLEWDACIINLWVFPTCPSLAKQAMYFYFSSLRWHKMHIAKTPKMFGEESLNLLGMREIWVREKCCLGSLKLKVLWWRGRR